MAFSSPTAASELPTHVTNARVALDLVKESEAAAWLAAPVELAQSARLASQLLFALSSVYAAKCPLRELLTDRFDAEQIWQQIDLQSQPLLSSLRRRVRQIERTHSDKTLFYDVEAKESRDGRHTAITGMTNGNNTESPDKEKHDFDMSDSYEDKENETETEHSSEAEDLASGDEEKKEHNDDAPLLGVERKSVEDRFLKLNDMERFVDEAEAAHAGRAPHLSYDFEDEELNSEEKDDDDMQMDDAHDFTTDLKDQKNETQHIKYRDFFGNGNEGHPDASISDINNVEPSEVDSDSEQSAELQINSAQMEVMSKHERKIEKIHKQMEQLEKANLEPKLWTMQGEVSATGRPKNSALEVDLDFEHNARPAPVITEEVTASLEDLIRNRIAEERFDDVQRKPSLPTSAPREHIQLDENKSAKGLGELYEAEYLQTTGLAAAPMSMSSTLKKEASILFRDLCVRLDALSHFHFTPKPVLENMSVHLDVPALAMEEVAPLVVSDAHMLAPEEVFKGEGTLKADNELSHDERKQRRAKKKRKSKAEKKRKDAAKKLHQNDTTSKKQNDFASRKMQPNLQSQHAKSKQVFANLDRDKGQLGKSPKHFSKENNTQLPSFLKL